LTIVSESLKVGLLLPFTGTVLAAAREGGEIEGRRKSR
jgi:hypothetical protein